jgi:ADP-ribose pyrophosphatase YjhB (NUDIX family)
MLDLSDSSILRPCGRNALAIRKRENILTDLTFQLSLWIQQLRAIAQTGLAFDPHTYDRERYEALLDLAATMAATVNGDTSLDAELAAALAAHWRADVTPGVPGYVTPKVGIGAVVFNARDELLMIQRPEGNWFIPTGWADIGYAPAQVAAKEVREETGLQVTPQRVVGIYDAAHWFHRHALPYFYSIVFDCRLDGGELCPHPVETRGAGFFPLDALPQPTYRKRPDWIDHALAIHRGERVEPYFDPA